MWSFDLNFSLKPSVIKLIQSSIATKVAHTDLSYHQGADNQLGRVGTPHSPWHLCCRQVIAEAEVGHLTPTTRSHYAPIIKSSSFSVQASREGSNKLLILHCVKRPQ